MTHLSLNNRMNFAPDHDYSRVLAGQNYLQRMPSEQASVISLHNDGLLVKEQFVSLLSGAITPALFHTPVEMFSNIPFGHLQMTTAVLNFLRGRIPFGLLGLAISSDFYRGLPFFQRLFQNAMQKLKIESNQTQSTPQSTGATSSTGVQNQPSIQNQPSVTSTGNQDRDMLNGLNQQMQAQINRAEPEPKLKNRWDNVNKGRAAKGQAPLNFQEATNEVNKIMNDPKIPEKDKGKKIEELRKKWGLGKGDMKALFTKRLAKIYAEFANKIKEHLKTLEAAVKQAEKTFGKDSAQAQAARSRLESARQIMEPTMQKWDQTSKTLHSMYRSFWSKLGGVFKSIVKVFTKIMDFITPFLKFIPIYGQLISFAWGALKSVVGVIKNVIQGNWGGILKSVLGAVKGFLPGDVGSIIDKVSSFASKAISIGKGIYQAAKGNFMGLVNAGLGALGSFGGDIGKKISDYAGKAISFGQGIYQGVKGNWSSFINAGLGALGSIPGSTGEKISGYASQAASVGLGIHQATQGNFGGLINTGVENLSRIPSVNNFFENTQEYLKDLINPAQEKTIIG